MSPNNMRWLIGAKIICCVGLLLVVSGALSLAAIGTFLTGNALPLVGGGAVILLLARGWQRRRTAGMVPPVRVHPKPTRPEKKGGA